MLRDVFTDSLCIGTATIIMAGNFMTGTAINTYRIEQAATLAYHEHDSNFTNFSFKGTNTSANVLIEPFDILKRHFIVNTIDKLGINAYSNALDALLNLNLKLKLTFGDINVGLGTYNVDKQVCLLVTVFSPVIMPADEVVDKFYAVTEKWYSETDFDVSESIFINLV